MSFLKSVSSALIVLGMVALFFAAGTSDAGADIALVLPVAIIGLVMLGIGGFTANKIEGME